MNAKFLPLNLLYYKTLFEPSKKSFKLRFKTKLPNVLEDDDSFIEAYKIIFKLKCQEQQQYL